jgi:hypothetical protein
MKRILSVLALGLMLGVGCATAQVAINETNFPDATFRSYVKTNFDTNGNDTLSAAEINSATSINVSYSSAKSLKGIEYFTSLDSLKCFCNNLASLDLSADTALRYLDCHNGAISSLDVSHCSKLTYLACACTCIDSIDVSACPNLDSLWCSGIGLKHLDVTKNPKLSYLFCADNTGITSIDLSNNPLLSHLDVQDDNLISIDLSGDTLLSFIDVSRNKELSELDVSNQKRLQALWCNYCSLSSLDVSKNSILEELYCSNNHLVALDLSANSKILNFSASDDSAEVKVNGEGKMDLSTLVPFGFDAAKASNWSGATLSGTELTFASLDSVATYKYDCGQGRTETFTLVPKVSTGVNTVAGAGVKAFATGNVINITGTDAQARVWDVAGRAVYSGADRQISVASAGVYIVKVADKTFKVIIK